MKQGEEEVGWNYPVKLVNLSSLWRGGGGWL